ncbi:MAG: fatty acid desaturase [Cyanobacteria bacterium J06642_2]
MSGGAKTVRIPRELLVPPDSWINTNVLLFVGSYCLALSSFLGYAAWDWPRWIVFICNFLALYVLGTVIHDATHGAAHRNRFVNEALGHGSAILQGFVYPVFKRVHIQHHAHVNDPENDPDHYVSTGGPLWLIPVRFFYHEVYFFKRRLWRKGKYDLLEWFISRSIAIATFTLAAATGYSDFLMNYWLPPAFIMGLLLGLFFDYLPHRPFVETARWQNARVYANPITNIFLLGQNYHLIHHLWPSIPWYKYQEAYHIAKPVLDARNCDQSLDIWRDPKNILNFLYDCFIGIRWNGHHDRTEETVSLKSVVEAEAETASNNVTEIGDRPATSEAA